MSYNPDWDRVVRQLATHYGMYAKIKYNAILAGINALTR